MIVEYQKKVTEVVCGKEIELYGRIEFDTEDIYKEDNISIRNLSHIEPTEEFIDKVGDYSLYHVTRLDSNFTYSNRGKPNNEIERVQFYKDFINHLDNNLKYIIRSEYTKLAYEIQEYDKRTSIDDLLLKHDRISLKF
ncbi:hypothetical protein [Mammaliicoccus phage vB_MscM-PMS3]|nr:hypothetical protein [Mammaliicoccus phage vB_MscM-PMS3]